LTCVDVAEGRRGAYDLAVPRLAEGHDFDVDGRYASGDGSRLPVLAQELV
jgi:hypothetical protein